MNNNQSYLDQYTYTAYKVEVIPIEYVTAVQDSKKLRWENQKNRIYDVKRTKWRSLSWLHKLKKSWWHML